MPATTEPSKNDKNPVQVEANDIKVGKADSNEEKLRQKTAHIGREAGVNTETEAKSSTSN